MSTVKKTALPPGALHEVYQASPGCFTDCYEARTARPVTLAQFVEAFYTAPLFKCERLILGYTLNRPSTDADVRAIAAGSVTRFAAWDMEARRDDQLLMCDMAHATRSWFMVAPIEGGTALRFGSVVTPKPGTTELPKLARSLMGFHALYSRLLLKAAVRRLSKTS